MIGLGVDDSDGIEIMGAYLELDGNLMESKVGACQDGSAITALDVAKAMSGGWRGTPEMAIRLGCGARSISTIMARMKDAGLAVFLGSNRGWELSPKALDAVSMTGAMLQ